MALAIVIATFIAVPSLSYLATRLWPIVVLIVSVILLGVGYFGSVAMLFSVYLHYGNIAEINRILFYCEFAGMGIALGFCINKLEQRLRSGS